MTAEERMRAKARDIVAGALYPIPGARVSAEIQAEIVQALASARRDALAEAAEKVRGFQFAGTFSYEHESVVCTYDARDEIVAAIEALAKDTPEGNEIVARTSESVTIRIREP